MGTAPLEAYDALAVVAHSMGGLVAQRSKVDHDAGNRIGNLILFCTPSLGLKKAAAGSWLTEQTRDLAENSGFIRALRADWTRRYGDIPPFRFAAVAGESDDFVPFATCHDAFREPYRQAVPGDHLQAVKPTDRGSRSVRLVVDNLCGRDVVHTAVDSARLAVEQRDFRRAQEALEPRAAELDKEGLVLLALSLDGLGRSQDAIRVLEEASRRAGLSTDAAGVLGGRIKRRWLANRVASDLERALELYQVGLAGAEAEENDEQVFYHAINIAFLRLIDSPTASAAPKLALEAAAKARDAAERSTRSDHWRLATIGDAQAIGGDFAGACESYRLAMAREPSHRERDSIYDQAVRIAARLYGRREIEQIQEIFGVTRR